MKTRKRGILMSTAFLAQTPKVIWFKIIFNRQCRAFAGLLLFFGFLAGFNGCGSSDTTQALDETAPSVSSIFPEGNATGVAINSAIIATFTEEMDPSTITSATFILISGTQVAGTVSCSGNAAKFTPLANWAAQTTYNATVTTGVKDLAGNAMESDYSWGFTTGSASDAVPPSVLSTSPARGSLGVAVNEPVTATFTEAMDAATITTSTFTLKDSNDNHAAGQLSFSGPTVIFTPSLSLYPSTVYTVMISSAVRDLAGNYMLDGYTFYFTTADASAAVDAGHDK